MSYGVPGLDLSPAKPKGPFAPRGSAKIRTRLHLEELDTGRPSGVRKKHRNSRLWKVEVTYGAGHGHAHKTRFYLPYAESLEQARHLHDGMYAYAKARVTTEEAWQLGKDGRRRLVNDFLASINWPTRMRAAA